MEKRALGKGLSSLIPLGRSDKDGNKIFECPLNDIVANENQPRKLFDRGAIDELASSIEEKGILQPILVRKLGGGKYEIIAGERRYRAAKQLKFETIPVIVKDIEGNEVMEVALIENLQRQDLNPIEEALAYQELMSKYQYTQDELAKKMGKDRSSIANTLRLLKLPEEIRGHLISNKLSMGHARALLSLESRDLQLRAAEQILKNDLSVRDIENLTREVKESQNETTVDDLDKVAGPKKISNPFKNLEEELKKMLRTKVLIKSTNGKKGKLIINFHTQDELEAFFNKLVGAL
ncbi:ParB/RepB/Spo0J family partition protein [bacterium]|nr:ParB/RepB/Spo0J family partition protein [bacterium]